MALGTDLCLISLQPLGSRVAIDLRFIRMIQNRLKWKNASQVYLPLDISFVSSEILLLAQIIVL